MTSAAFLVWFHHIFVLKCRGGEISNMGNKSSVKSWSPLLSTASESHILTASKNHILSLITRGVHTSVTINHRVLFRAASIRDRAFWESGHFPAFFALPSESWMVFPLSKRSLICSTTSRNQDGLFNSDRRVAQLCQLKHLPKPAHTGTQTPHLDVLSEIKEFSNQLVFLGFGSEKHAKLMATRK